MKRIVKPTGQFHRDIKLAKKQNRDLALLFDAVEKLANGERLAPKFRDHGLAGNWKDARECHIEPDWLLVYEIRKDVLILNRVGTHSELFGK